MKKNLIALLIVALVAVGLFADANTPNTSFNVTTTVLAVNEMKLTAAALSGTPATLTGVDAFTGPVTVKNDGTTNVFSAYITTLSNNRKGYTVKMSATPMKSDVAVNDVHTYINFKVDAGTASYTTVSTGTAPDPVTVISQGALSGLAGQSKQISLSVIASEFAAATEGSYTGIVTFEYTSTT